MQTQRRYNGERGHSEATGEKEGEDVKGEETGARLPPSFLSSFKPQTDNSVVFGRQKEGKWVEKSKRAKTW